MTDAAQAIAISAVLVALLCLRRIRGGEKFSLEEMQANDQATLDTETWRDGL